MKQLKYLSVALLFIAAGCTGNFDEINRNPNEVTYPELEADGYLINTNLKGMQNLVIPTQEHLYQMYDILAGDALAGYAESTLESWKDKFSTFNPPANWQKAPFVDVLTKTYPFYRELLTLTEEEVAHALAKLYRVAIMHRMTDTYGPIPYTRVVKQGDMEPNVEYDSQEAIYDAMFAELDEVTEVLGRNVQLPDATYAKGDGVYQGNIAKWIKYANSLKLRMAMRLTYIAPAKAKEKATEAIAGGIIEQNIDNALMSVTENRLAMIFNDWNDHRIAADLICYMNGYKDPRRMVMLTTTLGGSSDKTKEGYYGIRVGIDPTNKDAMVAAYSNQIISNKDKILWMNAAEVAFLRAEYALRWETESAAKDFYAKAIALSFEERGVKDATAAAATYAADAVSIPEAYTDPLGTYSVGSPASRITVKWQDGTANFEPNLERIITQKWIAIFPLGVEAWSEHRRTGYPKLLPSVLNKSNGKVNSNDGMRRLNYPAEEYSSNSEHVAKAVSTYLNNNDTGGQRIWWDCKTL